MEDGRWKSEVRPPVSSLRSSISNLQSPISRTLARALARPGQFAQGHSLFDGGGEVIAKRAGAFRCRRANWDFAGSSGVSATQYDVSWPGQPRQCGGVVSAG